MSMPIGKSDFELSMDELRVVARYAVESAQEVLPLFEEANSVDLRPRLAIGAAWEFVHGAARTRLQRVTALDAHRAGPPTRNTHSDRCAQPISPRASWQGSSRVSHEGTGHLTTPAPLKVPPSAIVPGGI